MYYKQQHYLPPPPPLPLPPPPMAGAACGAVDNFDKSPFQIESKQ